MRWPGCAEVSLPRGKHFALTPAPPSPPLPSARPRILQAHPELQASPFYIVGESFAGHYVPAIASYLYKANANPPPGDIVINLKGVAIGNGLVQPAIQYNYYQQYVWQYAIEVRESADAATG